MEVQGVTPRQLYSEEKPFDTDSEIISNGENKQGKTESARFPLKINELNKKGKTWTAHNMNQHNLNELDNTKDDQSDSENVIKAKKAVTFL